MDKGDIIKLIFIVPIFLVAFFFLFITGGDLIAAILLFAEAVAKLCGFLMGSLWDLIFSIFD